MKWILVVGAAALTLQWVLVPVPGAPQRVSVAVALVMAATAVVGCSWRAFADVLTLTWPFVAGMGALSVVWVATQIFHGNGFQIAAQQGIQLGIFVAVATLVAVLCGRRDAVALMRWTGVLGTGLLVGSLWLSLAVNQIDPASVLSATVAAGDPNILQSELFRDGLVGFGFEANELLSNIRHEIFAALLLCLYISETAIRMQPFGLRAARFVTRSALALAVVLVVVSLSRSVTIALLAWPVLAGARAWQRREVSRRQAAVLAGVALTALAAAATGLGSIVLTRFTEDTTSYDKRGLLLDAALRNIADNVVTGGVDTRGASSHNFILDTWLRTGLPGALLALAVTTVLIGLWVSLVVRLGREPAWMVPVVAALTLVIVRLFTAGGGTLPPVEWVAIGVVAGFMTHRARLRDSAPAGASHLVEPMPAAGAGRLAR